jgi:3-oxoacyl-[acyl-carrier protein] reductase
MLFSLGQLVRTVCNSRMHQSLPQWLSLKGRRPVVAPLQRLGYCRLMTILRHKAALVTGGSRGIGRAIAERLAADGASVVLSFRSAHEQAAAVVTAITEAGGTAHAVQADLADPSAARRLYDEAERMLGPLDILVNNAGIAPHGMIADLTGDEFGAVVQVNLTSPFVLIQQAARRLRDGGRIVNISTMNTVWAGPGMAPYAASKAALELLGKVASFELGAREITVNAVLPGATDTDLWRQNNPDESSWPAVTRMTALGRIGEPAEVAAVVAMLAGPDGRWLTGQSIRASGGLG